MFVCFLCLAKASEEFYMLNCGTPSIYEQLELCCPSLDLDRFAEAAVCTTCKQLLDLCYNFVKQCYNTSLTLRRYTEMISNTNIKRVYLIAHYSYLQEQYAENNLKYYKCNGCTSTLEYIKKADNYSPIIDSVTGSDLVLGYTEFDKNHIKATVGCTKSATEDATNELIILDDDEPNIIGHAETIIELNNVETPDLNQSSKEFTKIDLPQKKSNLLDQVTDESASTPEPNEFLLEPMKEVDLTKDKETLATNDRSIKLLEMFKKTGRHCNICFKNFKRKKFYLNHVKLQHADLNLPNNKIFKCNECNNKLFDSLKNLRVHYKTHRFVDELEEKAVKVDGLPNIDVSSTIGDNYNPNQWKMFTCRICEEKFHCKSFLIDHTETVHGIQMQNQKSANKNLIGKYDYERLTIKLNDPNKDSESIIKSVCKKRACIILEKTAEMEEIIQNDFASLIQMQWLVDDGRNIEDLLENTRYKRSLRKIETIPILLPEVDIETNDKKLNASSTKQKVQKRKASHHKQIKKRPKTLSRSISIEDMRYESNDKDDLFDSRGNPNCTSGSILTCAEDEIENIILNTQNSSPTEEPFDYMPKETITFTDNPAGDFSDSTLELDDNIFNISEKESVNVSTTCAEFQSNESHFTSTHTMINKDQNLKEDESQDVNLVKLIQPILQSTTNNDATSILNSKLVPLVKLVRCDYPKFNNILGVSSTVDEGNRRDNTSENANYDDSIGFKFDEIGDSTLSYCPFCENFFRNMLVHMKLLHTLCPICNAYMRREKHFSHHMKVCFQIDSSRFCRFCCTVFGSPKLLASHIIQNNSMLQTYGLSRHLVCVLCSEQFANYCVFQRHSCVYKHGAFKTNLVSFLATLDKAENPDLNKNVKVNVRSKIANTDLQKDQKYAIDFENKSKKRNIVNNRIGTIDVCFLCREPLFKYRRINITEHYLKHCNQVVYECAHCARKFLDKSLVQSHCNDMHENSFSIIRCFVCLDVCFNNILELRNHVIKNHASQRVRKCFICHIYILESLSAKHFSTHAIDVVNQSLLGISDSFRLGDTEDYVFDDLLYRFNITPSDHIHCNSHNMGNSKDVNKFIFRKEHLKHYVTLHSSKGAFQDWYACLQCEKFFPTALLRNYHQRNTCFYQMVIVGANELSNYECMVCDFVATSMIYLQTHYKNHCSKLGFKRLMCNECHRSCNEGYFDYLSHFNKFHQNDKIYICEICKKKFRFYASLIRHKKEHSNDLSCEVCQKKFKSMNELTDHTEIHFDVNINKMADHSYSRYPVPVEIDEVIKCDECLIEYVTIKNFLEHTQHVLNNCIKCNYIATNYCQLYIHQNETHNLLEKEVSRSIQTGDKSPVTILNVAENIPSIGKTINRPSHVTVSLCDDNDSTKNVDLRTGDIDSVNEMSRQLEENIGKIPLPLTRTQQLERITDQQSSAVNSHISSTTFNNEYHQSSKITDCRSEINFISNISKTDTPILWFFPDSKISIMIENYLFDVMNITGSQSFATKEENIYLVTGLNDGLTKATKDSNFLASLARRIIEMYHWEPDFYTKTSIMSVLVVKKKIFASGIMFADGLVILNIDKKSISNLAIKSKAELHWAIEQLLSTDGDNFFLMHHYVVEMQSIV